MDIAEILKAAVERGASDVHLVIGKPPMIRERGKIRPLEDFETIDAAKSQNLIFSILDETQRKKFEAEWELDCSFMIRDLARFRINVFKQCHGIEAVLRIISSKIPSPEEIGLTEAVIKLTDLTSGLILVTGPTGSGKTTTLASMLDLINGKRQDNIITVEDPIEFMYEHNKSVIRQREVGQQTKSFATALRQALREDPDVILIGEMRDLETITCALSAAETGHLVFGTLHTSDAPQTIDRIIDVFPAYQQQQVRTQLAVCLKAVMSQLLVPRLDGTGRLAAREIMIVTPAISNLIRESKTHMIYGAIDTGSKYGMISMDKCLSEYVKRGWISIEDALARAHNQETVRSSSSGGRSVHGAY
ncbi:MAG: type IV pilus twitching motility protein PilT [bacterium]